MKKLFLKKVLCVLIALAVAALPAPGVTPQIETNQNTAVPFAGDDPPIIPIKPWHFSISK